MIFQVNPVNVKTSVVNHIGDRAVAAGIPIEVEFERRFAERLSDHPLNVCEKEGNTVLRLLGKILAQRGKAGIRRVTLRRQGLRVSACEEILPVSKKLK